MEKSELLPPFNHKNPAPAWFSNSPAERTYARVSTGVGS